MDSTGAPGIAVAVAIVGIIILRWASIKGRPQRAQWRRERAAGQRQAEAQATTAAFQARTAPRDQVPDAARLDTAQRLVVERQDASVAMLTREMGVGGLTALRYLVELERRGVVGPPVEGGSRRVLVQPTPEDDEPA